MMSGMTLLRAHMHHKYKDMPCVGGYLDGTVEDKVGDGNRKIFDGLNAQYGNKKIALIQTSDSRSETYNDLGKYSIRTNQTPFTKDQTVVVSTSHNASVDLLPACP